MHENQTEFLTDVERAIEDMLDSRRDEMRGNSSNETVIGGLPWTGRSA